MGGRCSGSAAWRWELHLRHKYLSSNTHSIIVHVSITSALCTFNLRWMQTYRLYVNTSQTTFINSYSILACFITKHIKEVIMHTHFYLKVGISFRAPSYQSKYFTEDLPYEHPLKLGRNCLQSSPGLLLYTFRTPFSVVYFLNENFLSVSLWELAWSLKNSYTS